MLKVVAFFMPGSSYLKISNRKGAAFNHMLTFNTFYERLRVWCTFFDQKKALSDGGSTFLLNRSGSKTDDDDAGNAPAGDAARVVGKPVLSRAGAPFIAPTI